MTLYDLEIQIIRYLHDTQFVGVESFRDRSSSFLNRAIYSGEFASPTDAYLSWLNGYFSARGLRPDHQTFTMIENYKRYIDCARNATHG